jgi:2-polyprenyl-3-methyl-5-hydroxy-6-metoxy-1,4-benzoquinol methylase
VGEPLEDADVETSSEGYARRFDGPVGRWFLEVQARATLELLGPWTRAKVLDVGGGHAQLTEPLLAAGHDVTVYGSGASCGDRLRAWTESGRVLFRHGDLLRAPWPDHAFDVVVAYRLLAHVRRWRELLAELARLARQAVLVDYPSRRSVNAAAGRFFPLKKGVEGDTRPFAVFHDAEIVEALAAGGLRPAGRRPEFFFPMALHRAVGSASLARALEAAAAGMGLTRALGSPVILRLDRHD